MTGIRPPLGCSSSNYDIERGDPLGLGHRNPGRLPLPAIFPLDLGEPKEDTGHHPANRPAEINLLGHCHDTDILRTPLREEIDPILLPPRQPIELPHHHSRNGARANRPLQARKRGSTEGLSALDIFKPLDCRESMPLLREPAGEFGFLAVRFLRAG